MSPMQSCLALDIGGTKVAAAIVEGDHVGPVHQMSVVEAGDHLFEKIVSLIDQVTTTVSVSNIGVACAGPMTEDGETVSPINIPAWQNFPLRQALTEATGCVVHIDGDVRALARAEGDYGAARGLRDYMCMVVSTGIGGALVVDGRLLNGASGNAGHLGHLNLEENGPVCSCGATGCLEALASGWAIARDTQSTPALASPFARRLAAQHVGRAVGSLASVLDITHCFIGGSVALGYGEEFFVTATQTARRYAQLSFARDIVVAPSGLGVEGPLLAAASVAQWSSR